MGIIRALVESADRFRDEKVFKELAVGCDYRPINWVIEFDPSSDKLSLKGRYKEELIRSVPMRADRSGKVSKDNIKPNLFVDNARYALGLAEGPTTEDAFKSFRKLHELARKTLPKCADLQSGDATEKEKAKKELDTVLAYLRLSPQERKKRLEGAAREESNKHKEGNNFEKKSKKETKAKVPDPTDIVAFTTAERYPFDGDLARLFWKQHLQRVCSDEMGVCSTCGDKETKPILRILPFKVRLFGERCPLLSVNTDEQQSFGSLGKGQLGNSPICIECAGKADRSLKFLTQLDKDDENKEKSSGRHAVVIARDDSKGKGKQPLGNQIAVFWTKEQLKFQVEDGAKRNFEDLARIPIDEFDEIPEDALPAKVGQCRALLEAPFAGGRDATTLPSNRFYLAVLSPNKSRLVVREWLESDIGSAQGKINRYMEALQVVHPDGRGVWWPPLPAMMEALRSFTSVKQKAKEGPRVPALGPDVMRKLIRCIYTGSPPPEALLTRAVRCFRVPDPPTDDTPQGRQQRERQMLWRMAMAAAMKLILTYDKDRKEQKAMEQLKTEHDAVSDYKQQAPYNCGALLAILEAVQRRTSSSGRGVNTTVVDRFYGAASTAPATVFANLINMATKAHLPKLRREGKEFFSVRSQEDAVNINDLMTEACKAIDDAGGFPPPLTPEQQAQFALGFYHQRAELNRPKRQPKTSTTNKANTTGGQV
ncbi:MAG: type I-C CRISPR-associated protein Cas8c/Csd1 [Deltaproteobacteria bacterium]|nr:type I-C CRISPR-associated protein Cas8c/Csd1 [Deltaproteobacteria bacterium]